jgi:hypothetical protein
MIISAGIGKGSYANMISSKQGHHFQGFEIGGNARVHVGDNIYGDSKLFGFFQAKCR